MTEIEQQRKIRHRLAVLRHYQEVTGNVSQSRPQGKPPTRCVWRGAQYPAPGSRDHAAFSISVTSYPQVAASPGQSPRRLPMSRCRAAADETRRAAYRQGAYSDRSPPAQR